MTSLTQVDLALFLSTSDAARAGRVIAKLAQHEVSSWVLAGSFALEVHLKGHRMSPRLNDRLRRLHDIDFLVDTFDRIPDTLGKDFAFRHIHPADPPGKTLLQAVDMECALRVDVFRAYGSTIERSAPLTLGSIELRLLSFEDIIARLARLSWNLITGVPVAAKYVRDLIAIFKLGDAAKLEAAWQDHRQSQMPLIFKDAIIDIQRVMGSRPELLVTPVYSKDPTLICDRCQETSSFRLADAAAVLSVLGYC